MGLIIAAIAISYGTAEIAKLYGGKWATIIGAAAWLLVALAAILSESSIGVKLKREKAE